MPVACQDMNTPSECLVQDITEDMGQVANGHTWLLGPYRSGHVDNIIIIIISIIINIIVTDELLFNIYYGLACRKTVPTLGILIDL